jgi:hypothetical protein
VNESEETRLPAEETAEDPVEEQAREPETLPEEVTPAVAEVAESGDPPPEPSPTDIPAEALEAPPAAAAAESPTEDTPEPHVVEVNDLDWEAIRAAVAEPFGDERAEGIIRRMEERLAGDGPLGLAFEEHAADPDDQALHVTEDPGDEVWFIGDLHGDLLALEAALQAIDRAEGGGRARIVFLGDLFDDGRYAAEVVLRVFGLILERPDGTVTIVTGNHDEALHYREGHFTSSVLPSDFTDWLNAHPDHPWAARLGRLIIAFFARTPRAIFLPDGLLVAHGGVPHTDLHPELEANGNWNDPRVLQDFVWLRAHPRARKRLPNRTTRGSEFGRQDFEDFCALATRLGRPVARMVRGHDHVEERFAVFPAYAVNPVLTINAMSHRLPREVFGPYERMPVVARWVRDELPEVHRLAVPPELIHEIYPEGGNASGEGENR